MYRKKQLAVTTPGMFADAHMALLQAAAMDMVTTGEQVYAVKNASDPIDLATAAVVH